MNKKGFFNLSTTSCKDSLVIEHFGLRFSFSNISNTGHYQIVGNLIVIVEITYVSVSRISNQKKTPAIATLRNFGVTQAYLNKYLNNELNTPDMSLKVLD
ncbi:hypothetical protein [Flavivirga jejuensis]|uniref:Uncharacterized protein n=1 Tax=Flavivirga jejuensis TaxID=870487 RepID=A0ABT8WLP4_9FLAO|nr:hypothetical protein [Flavivirga jejuensis]MDO5974069.1 hypothetical protein [Flavivirga jejuensis]